MKHPSLAEVRKRLRAMARTEKGRLLSYFFKTGKGQYGEGDKFLGVMIPQVRSLIPVFAGLKDSDLLSLLHSPWHEERMLGFLILVYRYEKGGKTDKASALLLYIDNRAGVNNWDLVDLTAYKILGSHMINHDRSLLYAFAKSDNLWERRIAMITCFAFIKKQDFADALKIAEILLSDKEDLMHKASGWMLREIGKRGGINDEEAFLKKHHKKMPRTMLRYAIERFPEAKRKYWLNL